MHSFEVHGLIMHDGGDAGGRGVWLRVIGTSSHRCCSVACRLVLCDYWALAHHVGRHLEELTDLGRQRAGQHSLVQILGWGRESKHESEQLACVVH